MVTFVTGHGRGADNGISVGVDPWEWGGSEGNSICGCDAELNKYSASKVTAAKAATRDRVSNIR